MRDGPAHGLNERIGRLRKTVVHPQPSAFCLDEACAAQVREVPRGFGLRDLERAVDVADADFACPKQAEDAQPGAVRKGLKKPFHRLNLRAHIYALTNIVAAANLYIR